MTTLHSTPRADGFYMPAEWAPQTQTWMIWPERPDNWRLGGKPAQAAHVAVAKAIARFEPVTVAVSAGQYENARARLDVPNIRVVEMSSDDAWVRDTGPTFVINNTTEECLLNRNRNPHLDRAAIEAVLSANLAVDKIIWLPDGLFNDETDGHVDNFCCYVRPGEVLLAWTDDPQDPNYARCHAAMDVLQSSTDAQGRSFTVHKMPIPGPLYATEEECAGVDPVDGTQERNPSVRLAGSYVNFLIVNGGIIAPSFDDPLDSQAKAILQSLFPQHEVVMVPGRELLLGGGNIHCLTQQQPAPHKN